MKRKILKNKNLIIFSIIVAFFTFLSFFFDQLVVQQENNIRKMNTETSNKRIEISKGLFLINSIFSISKDLSYSSQIKKNTLDHAYSRHSLFSNPEDYGKFKDKILISGVDGFKKHKIFHEEIFINVLKNHNNETDLVKFYIDNFKKDNLFLNAIKTSEYDLTQLNENLDKLYFTKDDFKQLEILQVDGTNWDLLTANKDPFYNFYSEARDKLNDLGYIGDLLYAAGKDIIDLHLKEINIYEKKLIDYSKIKNKKNLYILLSILFQILSLSSLMYLFKIIINQEKK